MRYAILIALMVLSCASPPSVPMRAALEEEPKTVEQIEAEIQVALEASRFANIGLMIQRPLDQRTFTATKGLVTPTLRYISSSTSKPVFAAVILDVVARRIGGLTLRSRACDFLPGFAANALSNHCSIELRHLLSFSSGFHQTAPACEHLSTWPAFSACVDDLPLSQTLNSVPGEVWGYSSTQMNIAGAMAVVAAGAPDFATLFDDWRARTGLFAGAYPTSTILAPSSVLMITMDEYLAFLSALDLPDLPPLPPSDGLPLAPAEYPLVRPPCGLFPSGTAEDRARLCAAMQTDQIPASPVRTSTTFTTLREDWHFGFALWIECPSFGWSCAASDSLSVSSFGVAGQYVRNNRDPRHRYRLVLTHPVGASEAWAGVLYTRRLAPLLDQWAVAPVAQISDAGDVDAE